MKHIPVGNAFALVDNDVYELVVQLGPWYLAKKGYAKANAPQKAGKPIEPYPKTISMHRLIMGICRSGDLRQIDHINGNRLDNRRCNLRICGRKGNAQNKSKQKTASSSQYKGVTKTSANDGWVAQIMVDHRNIYLGTYDTPEDAAKVYDHAAVKYFEEFAKTNFPYDPDARMPVRRRHRRTFGVTKIGKRWQARPYVNGELIYLGRFDSQEEAIRASQKTIQNHKVET